MSAPSSAEPPVWDVLRNGDSEAVVELLDSQVRDIRWRAVHAIGRRRLIDGAPSLERLASTDNDLKLRAMLSLAELALPESRSVFLEGLHDKSADRRESRYIRRVALRGLARIDDPSAASTAEDFYRSGTAWKKKAAIDALEHLANRDALDVLARLLGSEWSPLWRVRLKRATHWIRKHGDGPTP
jgi:HEAT repeat protein